MDVMFFDGWRPVIRTVIMAVSAYAGLVFLMRISGKRTLSKMNAFDFVITVAFGSALAAILLNKDVSLVQGITALAMLVLLQFIVTFTSVRLPRLLAIVKSQPALLLYKGEFIKDAMKRERYVEEEVRAAIRESGLANIKKVYAVIVETDGSLSVIPDTEGEKFEAFNNVRAPESVLLEQNSRRNANLA